EFRRVLFRSDLRDAASKASPVRQLRDELRVRAGEWRNAVKDLELLDEMQPDEATIEMYGAVTPGMKVPGETHDAAWVGVIRSLDRVGNLALHVEDPFDKRGRYLSFFHHTSPVVVKR